MALTDQAESRMAYAFKDADTAKQIKTAITAVAAYTGPAAVVAAIVNNGGGAAADGTIGVITVSAAITDNSGGTNATDTIAVLVDTGGTAAGAPTIASVANALTCLAAHINTNRTALIAAKDAVTELATKVNAILTSIKANGSMASS